MDVFIILQPSVNDFRVRIKGRKQENYKKLKRSDILSLLALLSADVKSAVLLMVPSLTKVEVFNFLLLHFPTWILFGSWTTCYVSGTCEKVHICKCQCFSLFNIDQWSVLS